MRCCFRKFESGKLARVMPIFQNLKTPLWCHGKVSFTHAVFRTFQGGFKWGRGSGPTPSPLQPRPWRKKNEVGPVGSSPRRTKKGERKKTLWGSAVQAAPRTKGKKRKRTKQRVCQPVENEYAGRTVLKGADSRQEMKGSEMRLAL